jgi:hypothetical protein
LPDIIKRIAEAGDCHAKNKADRLFNPMIPNVMTAFFNLVQAFDQMRWGVGEGEQVQQALRKLHNRSGFPHA